MEFFDKLTEKITSTSKDVANKAKEIADLASLNGKIVAQESLIEKYYKEIGRFMYEHREAQCDNGLEERYKLVDAAYEEIARLKAEIRRIKGVKECEGCGAEVAAEDAFCSKCGAAVPQDVPEEVHAEEVRDVTEETAEAVAEDAPVAEEAVASSAAADEAVADEAVEACAEEEKCE